jgi:hypothetical protein
MEPESSNRSLLDEEERTMMNIELSQTSVVRIMRPVHGRGGFQQLLRRLQPRVTGSVMVIDEIDFEKLNRYSHSYGRGGFQQRTQGPVDDSQLSFDFDAPSN